MSEETIETIFLQIAFRAMDTGKDLKLEKGKNTSTSKVLGGGFMNSSTDYDSLVLTVPQPKPERPIVQDEDDKDDEDDEDDEDDGDG